MISEVETKKEPLNWMADTLLEQGHLSSHTLKKIKEALENDD